MRERQTDKDREKECLLYLKDYVKGQTEKTTMTTDPFECFELFIRPIIALR